MRRRVRRGPGGRAAFSRWGSVPREPVVRLDVVRREAGGARCHGVGIYGRCESVGVLDGPLALAELIAAVEGPEGDPPQPLEDAHGREPTPIRRPPPAPARSEAPGTGV